MNKLTERLQKIADEIVKGESVADIGTDHGYLPIYLYEEGISEKVILADVSKGSLEKAQANCEKTHPEAKFDLRLGDGLKVLAEAEVDTVVIAGMGGLLMTEILGYDTKKSHSFKKFILQPRNHVGELRFWLSENGFTIVNEQLVKETRFFCEILTVVNGTPEIDVERLKADPSSIMWEVSETLLEFKPELLKPYIDRKIAKEKVILARQLSATHIDDKKVATQKDRIKYLESLGDRI